LKTTTIAQALHSAQGLITSVGKDSTNQFHKYEYVSAEAMITASSKALGDCGLSLTRSWTLQFTDTQIPVVLSTFTLTHADGETREFPPCPWFIVEGQGRPIDKALAGALTTSLSYFLRDLLMIPRVDENEVDKRDDSNHGKGHYQPAPYVPSAPVKKKPVPAPVATQVAVPVATQVAAPVAAPVARVEPVPAGLHRLDDDDFIVIPIKYVDLKTSKKGSQYLSINSGEERFMCFDSQLFDALTAKKGSSANVRVEYTDGMDLGQIVEMRAARQPSYSPVPVKRTEAFNEELPF